MDTMTSDQALNLLAQVAAQFRGTRQEHELIEKAFRTLNDALSKPVNAKAD